MDTGAYVPPHLREGYVAPKKRESPYLLSYQVKNIFKQAGWISGAGGDLYYNGYGDTKHPHLHLILGSQQVEKRGDERKAVSMLAWSDGRGTTFIRDGEAIRTKIPGLVPDE